MVVSTGVGGGIVLDGRLLDGAGGNAGHIGHIVVVPEGGRRCGCGSTGCLEAEASGLAIEAATGKPAAEATLTVRVRTGTLVGRAVAAVAALLDLRLAVVAGSVALGFGAPFFTAAQAELERVCRISYARGAVIRPAGLGADGPLIGGAAVARRGPRLAVTLDPHPFYERGAAGAWIRGDRAGACRLTSAPMRPAYGPEAEAFREKVQAFLAEHLPADWRGIGSLEGAELEQFVLEWRQTLREHGLIALEWPKDYGGGGLSPLEQVIVAEEFTKAGVPAGAPNDVFGIKMLGNTLLRWGTEEQKRHYLPRILDRRDVWCQGYSEPNAGSDLGNLGCRAVLDGDQWIINGQKIWTSGGHLADHIFLLVRNDPYAPKHKGITFLLVDMRQPGVEVRPIKMISGESEFNEVFFTDAVCPKDDVVGGVNNGWAVAMTLLGFERGEAAATVPLRFGEEMRRLIALAQTRQANHDPVLRQRLARCYAEVEIMRWNGLRTLTKFLAGHHPGPDAAISKLYWSEYHRRSTELAMDVLGADGLVPSGRRPSSAFQTDDVGAPNSSASWAVTFLNARAGTIYAGTSQIQRNILGEMVLGLPKEPKADGGGWAESSKAVG